MKKYTICGGNFLKERLSITVYRYQWLFIPTVGVFHTRFSGEWRIGFNWLNVAVSIKVYMPKE